MLRSRKFTLETPSRQSALPKATLMTTEVAKPEGEDVGPLWTGQAKVRAGCANRLLRMLGPGLVTGASDDDPSGIGTYSQVGAQFGYGLFLTMHISYPLMAAIQEICARIGRVTGCGIAANLRKSYPKPLLFGVVLVMVAVANIFNLGADLGAMGDALHLLVPEWLASSWWVSGRCSSWQFCLFRHSTCVEISEVADPLPFCICRSNSLRPRFLGQRDTRDLDPSRSAHEGIPHCVGRGARHHDQSGYLFFWQASQEAGGGQKKPRREVRRSARPEQADAQLGRIRVDTYIGMAFSNLVAFFIILTAASTLHAHGITQISTSALRSNCPSFRLADLRSRSLRAVSWALDFLPFLVLAASAAFAVGEACRWNVSLERTPRQAALFLRRLSAAATTFGLSLNFLHIDPVKALFSGRRW